MNTDEQAPGSAPKGNAATSALILFAVLFLLFFFRDLPLQLDPMRTANSPEQFDTTRALERLSRVLDGTPHPVDSDALDAMRERLLTEIEALGYQPELHDETACRSPSAGAFSRCARVQNITFNAGSGSGPALVLTAHYDSVEASPGFGDDGIGLAVWLEVAKHLKERPPTRPVVFLLTDGEEAALLGARAFADRHDYGIDVGRVINLEARGVRGPAMMFETGHPNVGVVTDWSKNGARLFSNSMMTAVYELLPNSTDLTVHIEEGHAGVNMAISDGLDFYHTAKDDLAHLDRASVQHMGDQALGAARAFLGSDWAIDRNPNAEMTYSDVSSRFFVTLPQTIAGMMLGVCLALAAMQFMRPAQDANWKKPDFRALALPPAVIVASGGFAWLAATLIGLVRPEPAFWVAHPEGLNSVFLVGVLAASALALAFVAPKSRREAIYASGWLWFLVVGWLLPRFSLIAHGMACAVLVLLFFPLIKLVEVTMGLGLAAVFGVLEALVIAPALGLIAPLVGGQKRVFAIVGAAFVMVAGATLFMRASSVQHPLALNFVAHYDMDARKAVLLASAPPGALSAEVRKQLEVSEVNVPGVSGKLANRPLDWADHAAASITNAGSTPAADGKTVTTWQLSAPGARVIRLRIPERVGLSRVHWNGADVEISQAGADGYHVLDCVGRACDGAKFEITIGPEKAPPPDRPADAKPAPWIVQGFWLGLPADAAATANVRDESAVPIQMGDVTIATTRMAQ